MLHTIAWTIFIVNALNSVIVGSSDDLPTDSPILVRAFGRTDVNSPLSAEILTTRIQYVFEATKAKHPTMLDPQRGGKDFTDIEHGMAVAITQHAIPKDAAGYKHALEIVFSSERADALLSTLLCLD